MFCFVCLPFFFFFALFPPLRWERKKKGIRPPLEFNQPRPTWDHSTPLWKNSGLLWTFLRCNRICLWKLETHVHTRETWSSIYKCQPLFLDVFSPQTILCKPTNPPSLLFWSFSFQTLRSWVFSLTRVRSLPRFPQPRCSRPLSSILTTSFPR